MRSFLFTLTVLFLIPIKSVAADLCSQNLEKVLYSADFQWESGRAQKMKLVVGTLKKSFLSEKPIAQIWNGKSCEAVCKVRSIQKENVLNPVAVDLDCQGTSFSPLAMSASILWGGQTSQYFARKPTLRLGTWIHGYEEIPLFVKVDRFTTPSPINRKVADFAAK